MKVFSDNWIEELKNRYHNRDLDRSAIYYYAVNPEFDLLRQEVEIWINYLPDVIKPKIISRLRKEKNFQETYNELFCGDVFAKLGYKIEYEKSFSTDGVVLTPDWYISKNELEILVEVFTLNPPIDNDQKNVKIQYLYKRLNAIKTNAIVNINYDDDFLPNENRSKEICQAIKQWLIKTAVNKGQVLDLGDITFEVLEISKANTLQWFGPTKVFSADFTNSLKQKIIHKVKKYKLLGKPMIVTVVPNFETFIDRENMFEILFGTMVYPLDDNENNQGYRLKDGIYNSDDPIDSLLSAVIWIPKQIGISLPMPNVGIFPNPNAHRQLSQANFKIMK